MKKLLYTFISTAVIAAATSCGNSTTPAGEHAEDSTAEVSPIVNDSMVYGLACDGTNDSVIIVYPFDGGDPVTYSCIDAHEAGRIIGSPSIGDWVGLVISKESPDEADMVINLDQLKGTWTYPVMPTIKEFSNMSKRMQQRMQRQAMADMPDSVKNLYMVPREYGFSLKRAHVAQAVGRVYSGNTLTDDSPVEYPKVKNYKHWYTWNGKLILISDDSQQVLASQHSHEHETFDTLEFHSLTNDSLVLTLNGIRYGFHRKQNALTANADAQKKAKEAADKKAEEQTNH